VSCSVQVDLFAPVAESPVVEVSEQGGGGGSLAVPDWCQVVLDKFPRSYRVDRPGITPSVHVDHRITVRDVPVDLPEPDPQGPAASLVHVTNSHPAVALSVDELPVWSVNAYPEAGEAVFQVRSMHPGRPLRACCARARDEGRSCVRDHDSPGSGGPVTPREELLRQAGSRARVAVRRYCVQNQLDRLVTLTYADRQLDPLEVVEDCERFFRRLRRFMGLAPGESFPYVAVRELHPGGHGYHVHIAVGRFIPQPLLERAWGHGFADIRKIRVRSGVPGCPPLGKRERARRVAGYLQKYLGKTFEGEAGMDVPSGCHRYQSARGFQARRVQCLRVGLWAAWAAAAAEFGGELPAVVFSSDEYGDRWPGPPMRVAFW
jgi:hypothetical protein